MLKRGQKITIGGKAYKVQYVNFTGAYVIPTQPKLVKVNGRTFTVRARGMLISASSDNC